jgi:hypothetical protein
MGRCGMDSSGSGHGPGAGSGEHGNEPLGSIKGMELTFCIIISFSRRIFVHGVSGLCYKWCPSTFKIVTVMKFMKF